MQRRSALSNRELNTWANKHIKKGQTSASRIRGEHGSLYAQEIPNLASVPHLPGGGERDLCSPGGQAKLIQYTVFPAQTSEGARESVDSDHFTLDA